MRILKLCPIILFALAIGAACNQDDSSPEPDDPDEKKRIDTPDIFIQEQSDLGKYQGSRLFPTDTVLAGNMVHIETPKEYQSYEWIVGLDPTIYNGPEFKIRFPNSTRVKVRLYGKNEDGTIDTMFKHLTVYENPFKCDTASLQKSTPLLDTFFGHNQRRPSDTFQIWMVRQIVSFDNDCMRLHFYNLPKGCIENEISNRILDIGYYAFSFESNKSGNGDKCHSVIGWGKLNSSRKKIKIKYGNWKTDFNFIYTYKGKK